MSEQTSNDIEEEWKLISGYIKYEVFNFGRIRKIKYGHILKQWQDKHGYLVAGLYKEQIKKIHRVHRLVAQEFIDNPSNKSYIDHIDNNKQNNCVNNIRWASRSENHMNKNK